MVYRCFQAGKSELSCFPLRGYTSVCCWNRNKSLRLYFGWQTSLPYWVRPGDRVAKTLAAPGSYLNPHPQQCYQEQC